MKLQVIVLAFLFCLFEALFGSETIRLEGHFFYEKTFSGVSETEGRAYIYLRNIGESPVRVVTGLKFELGKKFPVALFFRDQEYSVDNTPLKLSESVLEVVTLQSGEMTRLGRIEVNLEQYDFRDFLEVHYIVDDSFKKLYDVYAGELKIRISLLSNETDLGQEIINPDP
jgi:hypothetical protein